MSELEALHQISWNAFYVVAVPVLVLIGFLILMLSDKIPDKYLLISFVVIAVFWFLGIIIAVAMNWGVQEKIQELEQQSYTNMSCDQLRQNIVFQLKTNNSTYLDFQKDYYYHSCEVPLRDEVLKLRSEE